MSDSKPNHNEFDNTRYELIRDLVHLSTILEKPNHNIQKLAKILADCTEDIDTMLNRATKASATESADVPSCLATRCNLLKEVIIALSDALRESDRMVSRTVLMAAYLSSQVGRLTLNAHDDRVDKTARHCDEGSICLELNWVRPSTSGSLAAEEAFRVLEVKWDLLDLAVSGCDCLQCDKRRRAGGANM